MRLIFVLFILNLSALAQDNRPFTLGNPADSLLRADTNYVLLTKSAYSTVYSKKRSGPLMSAWHLQASDLGKKNRYAGRVFADALLPPGWYHTLAGDYANSGYDRGHLCDSEDRTSTALKNVETFAISNIVAQAAKLNRITWLAVETYCRALAKLGNEVYIYAGGAGYQGTVGHGVTIPAYCWKVITYLPTGKSDKKRLSRATTLAVLMPNQDSVAVHDWRYYQVPVSTVSALTGLHFPVTN